MNNIVAITSTEANPNIPALSPGDTVRVRVKFVEGEKERIQPFQGVVIRVHHHASGGNFTVRRVTHNTGVERTFLFQSPLVEKVEVLRHGKVRRANLYYLRGISKKAGRIKEKRLAPKTESAPETGPEQKETQNQHNTP